VNHHQKLLNVARADIRACILADEGKSLRELIELADMNENDRHVIAADATDLVIAIRSSSNPHLMEIFLEEYGLSTREGIALMCLAEALLRVPDAGTIDALIEDKIAPSDWGRHLGQSSSSLVNASTWALLLTGKVLEDDDEGLIGVLRGAVKRLSEPVIRTAVTGAMKELGRQFVLGRDIGEALSAARKAEREGFTFSYDMLGEAALTASDAEHYISAYGQAIDAIASAATSDQIRVNPSISIKLSALHPRYEFAQHQRVMKELAPITLSLARAAKSANIGLNIDAEEADRLDLSLDVIEAVLSDPSLEGWDGFGVVVQAYGQRAPHVIDWLYALAQKLERKIMVRLVKGAYWDTEIKRAQTLGMKAFPVFTRKASTDVSYIACARKLLALTDRIYPQFATHNAHSVSAILHMAQNSGAFEFQRLHGMGEALHAHVLKKNGAACRIYAPVGAHKDLLAYLVRRLLENGANSSFVNLIVDEDVPPQEVAADPFGAAERTLDSAGNPHIALPPNLFGLARPNSRGLDLTDPVALAAIDEARAEFANYEWTAEPILASQASGTRARTIINPAKASQRVGRVVESSPEDIEVALGAGAPWAASAADRAKCLNRAADLFETQEAEFFTLLAREAGKTLPDCVGELREAVDFLRYYAGEALRLEDSKPCGLFACISPWNFPLAIFTGQIAAALAAGNGVVAKPAEATPLIAARTIELLHEAGVPVATLQFLPGEGPSVGAALTSDPRIAGLCFTGSTATAQKINRSMANNLAPAAPLIAETGGLNAMIVDSTALPEQAVRDIVVSAFQSAGQRCSALRILYLQEDVADALLEMLFGAMDELSIGDPWRIETDIGPLIDKGAKNKIAAYIDAARREGCVLKELVAPKGGHFIAPAVIQVNSIADMGGEIFGPVLHVARFKAQEINAVTDAINACGYGLTFGLHTRIDDRVQQIVDRLKTGNIYVNRNQIGAVVGSQPFGGEGLSGTGPKAGGPHYVKRFTLGIAPIIKASPTAPPVALSELQAGVDALSPIEEIIASETVDLPGPTGESNRLSLFPRGVILCTGPDAKAAELQAAEARSKGCETLAVAPDIRNGLDGVVPCEALSRLEGIDGVVCWGGEDLQRAYRRALASRDGPLIPLICTKDDATRYCVERHICIDTTASGGNAALLAIGD
jgi:RHH-type proline utilization regulon transcriptional repressor/proline dehydrogenase/delta 1-pyrroline-5-carboxylate dehydrogenase